MMALAALQPLKKLKLRCPNTLFAGDFYGTSTTTVDLVRKVRRDLVAADIGFAAGFLPPPAPVQPATAIRAMTPSAASGRARRSA